MILPPHIQADDKVVLFDGVCKLCNGSVNFIIQRDEHCVFKFCSVQSNEGQAILQWFGLPTNSFATMLLIDGVTAYERSDAVLKIAGELRRPWRYLAAFRIIPIGLRDWVYDRIALNRYRLFGRHDRCMMPSPDIRRRFLGNG